jgi:hypothetical protein
MIGYTPNAGISGHRPPPLLVNESLGSPFEATSITDARYFYLRFHVFSGLAFRTHNSTACDAEEN